jgi:hypothetical protein
VADSICPSIESAFEARWEHFASFGKPPPSPDSTWRKLSKAIGT